LPEFSFLRFVTCAPQSFDPSLLGSLRLAESSSPGWAQNYSYDVVGNRWVTDNTNLTPLNNETPQSSSRYSSTVPNRINTRSYDAVGTQRGITSQ